MSRGNLYNYIHTRKVLVADDIDGSVYLDESHPKNAKWIAARGRNVAKHAGVEMVPVLEAVSDDEEPQPRGPIKYSLPSSKPEAPVRERKREGGTPTYSNLDMELLQLKIERERHDIEKVKLNNEKMRGNLMPTEMVVQVLQQNNKAFVSAFMGATESLLVLIAGTMEVDIEKLATFRGKLKEIVNDSMDDAEKNTKQQIRNIVAEFSEKRGVGERL